MKDILSSLACIVVLPLLTHCADNAADKSNPKEINSTQQRTLNLAEMPDQSCFFNHGTQAVGKNGTGLTWSLENSTTEATLQITLWTDKLPESGSSFQFSSATPLTERSIAYGDKNGNGYSSAEGPAFCTLIITDSKILDQDENNQQTGRQPHTFQLAGHISCLLANHSGGTMQFAGDLSCSNGVIMK